ncbi:hypothetical protein DSO57_1026639 [Entomophthora muscae]|uniref:Uncharacterized protein n=1 Tax=Entomophthora muscae TaxID=34485 RepID=A0ACC2U0J2_9FUNG|nr:hypothetical protein DSO57_1026639 [Entomophthora muscae]
MNQSGFRQRASSGDISKVASTTEASVIENSLKNPDKVDETTPMLNRDKRVCTFEELPAWAQDNVYILTGYRIPTNSYSLCFESLFYLHNETGNVYSHLIGFLGFAALAFTTNFYFLKDSSASWSDIIVIYIFIVAAMLCLGCSSLFHLVCCHSHEVSRAWNKCDYAGIVFLIVGSFFPRRFYCDNFWKNMYLGAIGLSGLVTLLFTVSKTYSQPKYRIHRTAMFLGLGLSGLFPIGHAIVVEGLEKLVGVGSIFWFISMGALYTIGAVIYGLRVPEKWYPGKFDHWFHSHQIFHVLVVTAAVLHYVGVIISFRYYHFGEGHCPISDLLEE